MPEREALAELARYAPSRARPDCTFVLSWFGLAQKYTQIQQERFGNAYQIGQAWNRLEAEKRDLFIQAAQIAAARRKWRKLLLGTLGLGFVLGTVFTVVVLGLGDWLR